MLLLLLLLTTMTPLHWGIAAFENSVSSDLFPGASDDMMEPLH
jgi:hypothetical protein